jgi:hypothetical protein
MTAARYFVAQCKTQRCSKRCVFQRRNSHGEKLAPFYSARTAALRQELLLRNEYLAAENRIPIRINIRAEAAPPFWSTAR